MTARRAYESHQLFLLKDLVTPYMLRKQREKEKEPQVQASVSNQNDTEIEGNQNNTAVPREDIFHLLAPEEMDLAMMHLLDFEGDEYMLDGEKRPSIVHYDTSGKLISLSFCFLYDRSWTGILLYV